MVLFNVIQKFVGPECLEAASAGCASLAADVGVVLHRVPAHVLQQAERPPAHLALVRLLL